MTFPCPLATVKQTVFRTLKLYDTLQLIRAPIDSQSPALCRLTIEAAGRISCSAPDIQPTAPQGPRNKRNISRPGVYSERLRP